MGVGNLRRKGEDQPWEEGTRTVKSSRMRTRAFGNIYRSASGRGELAGQRGCIGSKTTGKTRRPFHPLPSLAADAPYDGKAVLMRRNLDVESALTAIGGSLLQRMGRTGREGSS